MFGEQQRFVLLLIAPAALLMLLFPGRADRDRRQRQLSRLGAL
jgi:hypothetical protein